VTADSGSSPAAELLAYEERWWSRGLLVAGVDEVGRGPLAGPVVAAVVVLHRGTCVDGADDSKRLPAARREELYPAILGRAFRAGAGAASVREIDRLGIVAATTLAMRRALARLGPTSCHVVVDGRPVQGLGCDHEAVVGGDRRVHSVGCASIVAKVVRDRLMRRLAHRYPAYGWETNVGYGTAEHRAAIRSRGLTPHHRLSFAGQGELALGGAPEL
jgi:ribonuclease HII